jgi:four helix bundle protein
MGVGEPRTRFARGGGKEVTVLNIYPVILQFVSDVGALVPRIAHHDPDLARQLRRSSTSVALNVSEATYALGRTRTAAYNTALREMRESFTALEVSLRLGYLAPLDASLEDRIERILKTLYRLSFPRPAAAPARQ